MILPSTIKLAFCFILLFRINGAFVQFLPKLFKKMNKYYLEYVDLPCFGNTCVKIIPL